MPRITLDWLMSVGTPCGEDGDKRSWNNKQKTIFARILAVSQLEKGWTRAIVGREISLTDAHQAENLQGAKPKSSPSKTISTDDPELAVQQVIELVRQWPADARDALYWRLNELRSDSDDDIPLDM
jgi:hypothetical protein